MAKSKNQNLEADQPQAVVDDASLFRAVPLEIVPHDKDLPFPVYVGINDRFVLFRMKGDALTTERISSLGKKGVDTVYVKETDWTIFDSFLWESFKKSEFDKDKNETQDAAWLRRMLYTTLKGAEIEKTFSQNRFEQLKMLAYRMAPAIEKDHSLAQTLRKNFKDPAVYHTNHAVNTAIFSVLIGIKLKLEHTDLKELCLGALVANIGKLSIPSNVLYKKNKLSREEWDVLRKHPKSGAEELKKLNAPPTAITITLEHHERFDGQGYHRGLKGTEISLPARIVSVASVYDSLICERPWEQPYIPELAVEMMQNMVGRFDPKIMKMAIKAR